MADGRIMPMFPLGTVLFPYALLPLHVFEPRYRVMIRHVMDSDHEFGVVLIERGSEVGGGDVRFDIGDHRPGRASCRAPGWPVRACDGGDEPGPGRRVGCPTIPTRTPKSSRARRALARLGRS